MKKIILLSFFSSIFFCFCIGSLTAGTGFYPVSLKINFTVFSHDHCPEPVISDYCAMQLSVTNNFFEEKDDIAETIIKIKKRIFIEFNFNLPNNFISVNKCKSEKFPVFLQQRSNPIYIVNSVFRL